MTRPDVIPIPLRSDVTARLHMPLDLSAAEAKKICAAVTAYAALAAGSRRAKTPKAVECEASQSGAKRNAQKPHD